jgi:uncharacterized protein YjbI with pentapeptide repeats
MSADTQTPRSHRHESLVGADLGGADLSGVIFDHVDLAGADLTDARLDEAILRHCDLSGAKLSGVRMQGSSAAFLELRGADMIHADLRRASWHMCDVQETQLRSAKLDGGAFVGCRFDGADLSSASFFKTNTLHSVFARATFDDARMFAWSREIVVELLGRAADGVEDAKLVGAIALHQEWCYDEWRAMTADDPELRQRALDVMSEWPNSGFVAAFG